MIVLLVRHARAGKRSKWKGDDRRRPLDRKGRKEAAGLVDLLRDYPVERVLSSSYDRCTQTVEPLARERGLAVEDRGELAEGSSREDVLRLLGPLEAECVVLCTHGDVVDELVGEELPKGSTQVLELEDGELRRRAYLEPPG
jgi:phosphohistidine phosphatase SixA